jgi:hypothetical protein
VLYIPTHTSGVCKFDTTRPFFLVSPINIGTDASSSFENIDELIIKAIYSPSYGGRNTNTI